MRTMQWVSIFLLASLISLCGCGGVSTGSESSPTVPGPLSANNINLIFVVSEDLAYNADGDIDTTTANLTNRGLQRSLLMAPFLKQQVLGGQNVTGIYALEPMTHMQATAKGMFPDVVPLETSAQFAMLNQVTLSDGSQSVTANSTPIFASYSANSTPVGVAPWPICEPCQGLDFEDRQDDNETLLSGIIQADVPGSYVFSAPWETVSVLLANINRLEGYTLSPPLTYQGPNYIYAFSIALSERSASVVTYNNDVNPPSTYPVLPSPAIVPTPCVTPTFSIVVAGGVNGAMIPPEINKNETIYMIRHAEAHPTAWFEDGNYVAAGQWRVLDLPNALSGKLHPAPTQVCSIDPAIGFPTAASSTNLSYVRPMLTAGPYAIANHLPFNLAASIAVFSQNPPALATLASNYFFTGGTFSGQTLLVPWEHDHIPPIVNALLADYNSSQVAPNWPDYDYDAIWTITLDDVGNLTVNNALCEGINSATLPPTAPQF